VRAGCRLPDTIRRNMEEFANYCEFVLQTSKGTISIGHISGGTEKIKEFESKITGLEIFTPGQCHYLILYELLIDLFKLNGADKIVEKYKCEIKETI
jgi:hypothetical protein